MRLPFTVTMAFRQIGLAVTREDLLHHHNARGRRHVRQANDPACAAPAR